MLFLIANEVGEVVETKGSFVLRSGMVLTNVI